MHEARLADGDESHYRMAFAWQDPDADPATKAAYKFIHHEIGEDGTVGPANLRACITGIAVLNGARGGTVIPESDREGVYRHLAAHIRDAGSEPPDLKARASMETKNLPIELKQLGDDGVFQGFLSVYDFVDHGGDVVEKGAFTKTLKESSGRVHLCWQHDLKNPIGALELKDYDEALEVKGTLNLEIQPGRDAYSVMRFNQKHKLKTGLSIGFLTIKDAVDKGIRRLKEIKLFEGSIVTIPMNSLCFVTDVKSSGGIDDALQNELRAAQLSALSMQFASRGIDSLPTPTTDEERKALRDAISQLTALLGEDNGTSTEAACPEPEAAEHKSSEPEIDLHSWLEQAQQRWAAMNHR